MNILLNNYCNLSCSYCFANDVMSHDSSSITVENLDKILNFQKNNNIRNVRLLGGEPTLHPLFKYILAKIVHDPFFDRIRIFSNLMFEKDILSYIKEMARYKKILILPNCNERIVIGDRKYEKMLYNLKELAADNIIDTVGINIYSPNMDYKYIYDIADAYDIDTVRWVLTIPNAAIDKDFDVKLHFKKFANLLINFANDSVLYKKKLSMDCSSLPICAFADSEIRDMLYAVPTMFEKPVCESVIDVRPNLDVIRCFGLSGYYKTNLNNHRSLDSLIADLDSNTKDIKDALLFDECKDCIVYNRNNNQSCGCLAYKINR